ncbi:hypothetical protein AM265_05080, partial [Escherichia coli]
SLKTSIKTITYLSDTGCLEIQGASLPLIQVMPQKFCVNSKKIKRLSLRQFHQQTLEATLSRMFLSSIIYL